MGANKAKVPYLNNVADKEVAAITKGVCFFFGDNCNVVYSAGKLLGYIDYVGKPGPGMKFKVRGKKDSEPGEFDDKHTELLIWKSVAVPLME